VMSSVGIFAVWVVYLVRGIIFLLTFIFIVP
jgi:hypothetical protein